MHVERTYLALLKQSVAGLAVFGISWSVANPAIAQVTSVVPENSPALAAKQASDQIEDIVVTARKREETILNTPVVISVLSSKQIANLKITDMSALASVTPNLSISNTAAGVGSVVFLRGLGNGSACAFCDQSVLLNVDGAGLAHGSFYRTGLFDVSQIEVLKGPQSLFFGRSSSAGIIAIHSADPTPVWESQLTTGYEFNADEVLTDGHISGPLTETLGFRLAGFYRDMRGYLINRNPAGGGRTPNGDEYGGRATLKYENPSANLLLNGKFTYYHSKSNAAGADLQQSRCAGPTSSIPAYVPYEDCRQDDVTTGTPNSMLPYIPGSTAPGGIYGPGGSGFAVGSPRPVFRDGKNYQETTLYNAVLNARYELSPRLNLTSVTAFSRTKSQDAGASFRGGILNSLGTYYFDRNYSQELRLATDFGGRVNFVAGGLYNLTKAQTEVAIVIPAFSYLAGNDLAFNTKSWSAFGQAIVTPTSQIEIDIGGRWTTIRKYFTGISTFQNGAFGGPQGAGPDAFDNVPASFRQVKETAFTPEVTVSYRPQSDITLFASYKKGYKGPGFNISPTSTFNPFNGLADLSTFKGERVEGFEGGVKAFLLDHHLRLSLAGYSYKYNGLQVAFSFENNNVFVSNDSKVRVEGIDFDATFNVPSVQGLSFNTAVSYNKSYFLRFPHAPCYGGQTAATGCLPFISAFDGSTQQGQDQEGKRLARAPLWSGLLGMSYERKFGRYVAGLTVNSNFSSSYNFSSELSPLGVQHSFATVDASIRIGPSDKRWELAFIGRNLTNKIVALNGTGNAIDADYNSTRPWQAVMQISIRPDMFFGRK